MPAAFPFAGRSGRALDDVVRELRIGLCNLANRLGPFLAVRDRAEYARDPALRPSQIVESLGAGHPPSAQRVANKMSQFVREMFRIVKGVECKIAPNDRETRLAARPPRLGFGVTRISLFCFILSLHYRTSGVSSRLARSAGKESC